MCIQEFKNCVDQAINDNELFISIKGNDLADIRQDIYIECRALLPNDLSNDEIKAMTRFEIINSCGDFELKRLYTIADNGLRQNNQEIKCSVFVN